MIRQVKNKDPNDTIWSNFIVYLTCINYVYYVVYNNYTFLGFISL